MVFLVELLICRKLSDVVDVNSGRGAACCPMKNVSCWREPRSQTTTADHHRLRTGVAGVRVIGCGRQRKIIDDVSTVWLSIERMVAVHHGHLLQPHQQRPPSTPAGLLAARLQLQCLSMPGCRRPLDSNVDEEVSRLLRRPPSPQLPQPADRPRPRNRRAVTKRDFIAVGGDHAVSTRWAEPGVGQDKSSLCRLRRKQQHEAFKRPCLDFYKMQASQIFTPHIVHIE